MAKSKQAEACQKSAAKWRDKGICHYCQKNPLISGKKYCESCKVLQCFELRRSHAEFKRIIFEFYGNKCACCGETEPKFLTVDHINNDGNVARRATKEGGTDFYRQVARAIRDGNPPKDLQLLCRNCNWGKHVNGGICPHLSKYMEP